MESTIIRADATGVIFYVSTMGRGRVDYPSDGADLRRSARRARLNALAIRYGRTSFVDEGSRHEVNVGERLRLGAF